MNSRIYLPFTNPVPSVSVCYSIQKPPFSFNNSSDALLFINNNTSSPVTLLFSIPSVSGCFAITSNDGYRRNIEEKGHVQPFIQVKVIASTK